MQLYLIIFLVIFQIFYPAFADTISGNVRQDEVMNKKSVVVDSDTDMPVRGAKVSLPQFGYTTRTDAEGRFQLNANIDDKAILQVEKEGYRPFSLTIDKMFSEKPLRLGIQKTNSSDIYIDKGVFHLGDNVFSPNSANCNQFKLMSMGPYYYKNVKLQKPSSDKEAVLIFGSVIGLDTKLAKEMGQNGIATVYSSPLQVIFNGEVIAQISLNGDNQEIPIPNGLIKENNDLTIKTGKNLFQFSYTDYDDMEFANLRIEIKDKYYANK